MPRIHRGQIYEGRRLRAAAQYRIGDLSVRNLWDASDAVVGSIARASSAGGWAFVPTTVQQSEDAFLAAYFPARKHRTIADAVAAVEEGEA